MRKKFSQGLFENDIEVRVEGQHPAGNELIDPGKKLYAFEVGQDSEVLDFNGFETFLCKKLGNSTGARDALIAVHMLGSVLIGVLDNGFKPPHFE
jgi:hypothetical protein